MELKNTYKSKIIEKKISQDVYFASIDNFTNQTDTISKNIDNRFVQLYFCTKGNVTFHFSAHYSKVLENGNSFVIFNPEESIPLQISVSSKSKLVVLVLSIVELHHFFNTDALSQFFIDTKKKWYEEHPISNTLHMVFSQLETTSLNVAFEDLYYKNKITELLLLYFSTRISSTETCPYLSDEELAQKIKKAKEILLRSLSKNLKIADLSQEVNLSSYKLKEGFKMIYGSSINKFLLQHKMQLGKEMIEGNQKKIKEIASFLGYENPSHFIDAFKKTYGITPKQFELKLTSN